MAAFFIREMTEYDFWHSRWQNKQIGFHLPEANPLLVKHFSALDLRPKTPQKTSVAQNIAYNKILLI